MTEEEAEVQCQKCLIQTNALFNLNDEVDALLHASQLRNDTIDSKTVIGWLRMLHNIVRDGLERPHYPFPDSALKSEAEIEMERLNLALERLLAQELPNAQITIDPMRPGDKISGIVSWRGFKGLEPIDRHRFLWSKLRAHLSREDQDRISILITLTPAEYAVHREPQLV